LTEIASEVAVVTVRGFKTKACANTIYLYRVDDIAALESLEINGLCVPILRSRSETVAFGKESTPSPTPTTNASAIAVTGERRVRVDSLHLRAFVARQAQTQLMTFGRAKSRPQSGR
jgi:hypothetical protein